jgi:hypothetical protein
MTEGASRLAGGSWEAARQRCETEKRCGVVERWHGGGEAVRGKRVNLTPEERRALRRVAKHGRAGVTAKEIGGSEDEGMEVGARLTKHKLVAVTRTNRFMLVKYVGTVVPEPISWDE